MFWEEEGPGVIEDLLVTAPSAQPFTSTQAAENVASDFAHSQKCETATQEDGDDERDRKV
eukprot:SAG31_NODE_6310_length_2070_cov_3.516489_1_plen_60_part_00